MMKTSEGMWVEVDLAGEASIRTPGRYTMSGHRRQMYTERSP